MMKNQQPNKQISQEKLLRVDGGQQPSPHLIEFERSRMLQSPLTSHSILFEANSKLYVFFAKGEYMDYDELHLFDLKKEFWEETVVKSGYLPVIRAGHAGGVYKNKYYLFGGKFQDQRTCSAVEVFDCQKYEWQQIYNSLEENRVDHTAEIVDKYLVIFGGYESHRVFNDLKVFNIETQTWVTLSHRHQGPSSRYGHSSIIIDHCLFIFGGMNKQELMNDMWQYDFVSMSWSKINYFGLVKPLLRSTLTQVKDGFLIVGGAKSAQKYSKSIYYYSKANNTVSLLPVSPSSNGLFSARCLSELVQTSSKTILIMGGFNGSYLEDALTLKLPSSLARQPGPPEAVRYGFEYFSSENQQEDSKSEIVSLMELDRCSEWVEHKEVNKKFYSRTGHTMAASEGNLYIFGGTNYESMNNELWRFNEKEFVLMQPQGHIITPRSSCKSCESPEDGLIYFYGGYSSKKDNCFDDLYCYTPSTNHIKRIQLTGCPPPRRSDHSLVKHGNFLYIFGGCDDQLKYNQLFRIDLKTQTISLVEEYGEVPVPRFGHSANVIGTSMYVFGGWNGFETQDELYQFSMVSDFWYLEKLTSGCKPLPRYRHSSTRIGRSLFIFGGINQAQRKFNDLFEYCVTNREWTQIEGTGRTPSPRTFHQMAALDNKIFLVGGSSTEKLNDVYSISMYNIREIEDSDNQESLSLFKGGSFCISETEGFKTTKREGQITEFGKTFNEVSSPLSSPDDPLHSLKSAVFLLKTRVEEISQKLKEIKASDICVICCEAVVNCVILECGHKTFCYRCAYQFQECPVCRAKITRIVRSYDS